MKITKEQKLKNNKEKLSTVGADGSVNQMSKDRQNKGITLIALVITIIVMLILTAVTINMAINGGLFNFAGKAAQETQNAMNIEQELANGEINIDGKIYYSIEEYTKELNGQNIDIWDGEKVEIPKFIKNTEKSTFDWYIYTCAQFKFLADYVNGTLTEEEQNLLTSQGINEEDIAITIDTQIHLRSNLDLGAKFDEEGNLISGTQWTPIGSTSSKTLLGTFDGENHYISGVYIKETSTDCIGVFGNANSIKNLTVKNSYIEGNGSVGAIVGYAQGGTISNCNNENTKVVGNSNYVGGLIGQTAANIMSCSNSGNVYSAGSYAGGVFAATTTSISVTGCSNFGSIASYKRYAAGIGASMSKGGTVADCYNVGNVTGNDSVYGLTGFCANVSINNCYNAGAVTGTRQ